jgi:hypothetical protein
MIIVMDAVTLYVVVVIFLATVIRSTFGFGEALVAVPLLALRIPLEIAAPLAVLVSVTVAAVVVVQDWHKIHLGSASWLVLSTLFGIPLGLWLLVVGNETVAKAILGILIVGFSVYSLMRHSRMELKRDSLAGLLACGFCAGVLGGAYGLNGPPLVVYGTMRRWSAQHFRATLQGYFLPASAITMAGYWLTGFWHWPVTHYYLLSLPLTLIAIFLGRAVNHRFRGDAFRRYVYIGLVGIGILLLAEAMHR